MCGFKQVSVKLMAFVQSEQVVSSSSMLEQAKREVNLNPAIANYFFDNSAFWWLRLDIHHHAYSNQGQEKYSWAKAKLNSSLPSEHNALNYFKRDRIYVDARQRNERNARMGT
jgi:hypothetical protein